MYQNIFTFLHQRNCDHCPQDNMNRAEAKFGLNYCFLGYHEPPTTDLSLGLFQTKFPSMPQIPSIDYVPSNPQKQIDDRNRKVGLLLFRIKCYSVIFILFYCFFFQSTNSGVHLPVTDESLASMLYHIYEKYPNSFYASVFSITILIITTVWLCGRQVGLDILINKSIVFSLVWR